MAAKQLLDAKATKRRINERFCIMRVDSTTYPFDYRKNLLQKVTSFAVSTISLHVAHRIDGRSGWAI
jgi:hypothetical protein